MLSLFRVTFYILSENTQKVIWKKEYTESWLGRLCLFQLLMENTHPFHHLLIFVTLIVHIPSTLGGANSLCTYLLIGLGFIPLHLVCPLPDFSVVRMHLHHYIEVTLSEEDRSSKLVFWNIACRNGQMVVPFQPWVRSFKTSNSIIPFPEMTTHINKDGRCKIFYAYLSCWIFQFLSYLLTGNLSFFSSEMVSNLHPWLRLHWKHFHC